MTRNVLYADSTTTVFPIECATAKEELAEGSQSTAQHRENQEQRQRDCFGRSKKNPRHSLQTFFVIPIYCQFGSTPLEHGQPSIASILVHPILNKHIHILHNNSHYRSTETPKAGPLETRTSSYATRHMSPKGDLHAESSVCTSKSAIATQVDISHSD